MELTKTVFKQTEIGLIPEDWNVRGLEELSNITRLAGYEYSTLWEESLNGEIIALRGFNIGPNKIIEKDFVTITDTLSKRLIRSRLFKGDVIYPCVGSIGNAAVIREDDKYHIQQNIAKITPYGRTLDSDYLAYYLMSSFGLKEIEKFNGSSSQPNILVGSLRQYSIIVPTLTEQKAIATALSDVDSLISSLDKLITKKKAIKQGAKQELLTPPHKGGRRLPGFSGEWEEVVFTDICDLIHGHQFRTEDFNHNTEGIKVIKIGNVMPNKLITEGCDSISSDRLEDFEQYKLKEGDILMSLTGNIGRVVRLKEVTEHLLQNYRVGKFVPKSGVSSAYLSICLGSIKTTKQLEQLSNAGAQANFGKQDFNKVSIAIPSNINEQESIAQILTDMDLEIESLENKKAKYQEIKQGMMQELLTGKTRLI